MKSMEIHVKNLKVSIVAEDDIENELIEFLKEAVAYYLNELPNPRGKTRIYIIAVKEPEDMTKFTEHEPSPWQTTIVDHGDVPKIIIAEASWLRRGRSVWRPLILEALCHALIHERREVMMIDDYVDLVSTVEELDLAWSSSILTYECARVYEVHEFIASTGLSHVMIDYVNDILSRRGELLQLMSRTRIEELTPATLSHLLLLALMPIIVTMPYVVSGVQPIVSTWRRLVRIVSARLNIDVGKELSVLSKDFSTEERARQLAKAIVNIVRNILGHSF
ncbi:MAG: hypothetical protein DRN15_05030 [Thermoprotei archaeon]|nr:MAG: hypothetical protein DRM97_05725 [Thermoprotei archaeon]RLF23808.1 MAG: hypothetical protein DRN15_05030 [Thermoprotei archaeon]